MKRNDDNSRQHATGQLLALAVSQGSGLRLQLNFKTGETKNLPEVCPWNEKFSLPLREAAFKPHAAIAGKDARTLARELLEMSDEHFRIAFKGSPMKRAKLRGLRRNSAVVLGNVGSEADVPVLVTALADPEPLVRSHSFWALGNMGSLIANAALRERLGFEKDPNVREALVTALSAERSPS